MDYIKGKKKIITLIPRAIALEFLRTISPGNLSDNELLNLYKEKKDLALLADLYQRYIEMIFGVCLKYLKEPGKSKDAVMDIFEVLPAKVLKHDISNFRSWVYVLAKNHCLMQLRSSSNGKFISLEEVNMQSEEIVHHVSDEQEKEWQLDRLRNCIEKLSGTQKQTITLFYLENKCYKDISGITGLDWNGVRSLIQNGKRNLKICMERVENKIMKDE